MGDPFPFSLHEDELVTEQLPTLLYKDDCVELFIQNDGLAWGDRDDFQIGLALAGPDDQPQNFSWFQESPLAEDARLASRVEQTEAGDNDWLEARIPWSFLGLEEIEPGLVIGVSPSLHTIDSDRTTQSKLNWSYVVDFDRLQLGKFRLVV